MSVHCLIAAIDPSSINIAINQPIQHTVHRKKRPSIETYFYYPLLLSNKDIFGMQYARVVAWHGMDAELLSIMMLPRTPTMRDRRGAE